MINFKNLISKVSKVSKSQSLMRIIKVNFANFVNLVMSKFGEILMQKNKRVTGYGLQIAGAKKDQVKATKRQSDMSFLKGLVGEGMRGLGESYVESAFREGVKSRIGITKSCVETENGAKKDQAMHIKKDQAMQGPSRDQAVCGGDWSKRDQAMRGWSEKDQAIRGWSEKDQVARGEESGERRVESMEKRVESGEGTVKVGKDLTNIQRISNLSLTKGMTESRVDTVSILSRQSDLDQVRAVSVGLSARVWKHVAMIFAVLVMSMVNIGTAWGTEVSATQFTTSQSGTTYTVSARSGYGSLTGVTVTTVGTGGGTSSNRLKVPVGTFNFSVASGYVITSINVSWRDATDNYPASDSEFTANTGSVSTNTSTKTSSWTGSAQSVSLTNASSSKTFQVVGLTINYSSASSTYYYRGEDNSWGSTAMTASAGGTYEYIATTRNNHQFKITTCNEAVGTWSCANKYNYSYVDGGFYGTSITTIGDYSKDNCYIWSAPASYYIIVFKPSTAINTTSSPKICASATLPQDQFTISFAAGSGTGSMSAISSINAGADQAVTANSFTAPSGYQFAGWVANVDVKVGGSTKTAGTVLADGVTIQSITSDITLTAQWELIPTYDVTYNANSGGTGTTAAQTGNSDGAQVTTRANGFTPSSGKKFKWWNTASGGGGEDFYPGEKVTIDGADVALYAQWETVASNQEFWTPIGASASSSKAISITEGDMSITSGGAADAADINVDLTAGATTVSKYSSTAKHAKVLAIKNDDKYIQVSFTDGSPINKLWLGSTTNNTAQKKLVVIYSTTADFSTGEYEKKEVKVNGYEQTSKAVFDFSPSTADKYLYARIYRKISTAVYSQTGGDGATARIYSIKAQKGVLCIAPTALAAASPTAKGATLTVTDANDVNNYEFYVSTSSTAPEAGATATHSVSSAKSLTITNLVAGTTYYAWVRSVCGVSNKSGWTALGDGGTFTTSTVSVTHTLTNVTKTSGAETAGGSDYTAEFAAVSGYSMPTPTVTIDGNTATSGTDYTWNAGTGTITIPANKINGNIVITLNSVPSAPSSAVISGTYHYFPGENISLTCTPSGNNGPTTYQWYKGGKENGNAIEGATSATYTKNSCTFDDAGSYYCKVTCNATSIWANTNSSENYDVKILRLYVNGSKGGEPYGNVDFEKVNSTTARASISLGSNWTYGFNIADGCGHYYGNNGTMQYNSCTGWVTNVPNTDCGLTTTNAATYIFTIDYSDLSMIETSVTFPVANQASGKVIYFDNNVLKWTGSSIYYRIGHSSHSQADQLSLVPGTANLYKMTTREYNNFSAWQIGNAEGGNGSDKSIYNTKNTPAITASIAYEGGAVTDDAVTVTPGADHSTGGDEQNNNCDFYSKTITNGMKTDRVTISSYSNGTITVNYVNTSGSATSFTSGYADLAHTVVLTSITAVPATGYEIDDDITINGNDYAANYVVTGATTVAASFKPQTYSITYKDQGGSSFSGTHADGYPTTHTYATATTLKSATKTGYTFDGWFTNSACTGDAVTSLGATDYTADITLYAKWTVNSHTLTWDFDGGSSDETAGEDYTDGGTLDYGTSITYPSDGSMSKAGYTFEGWDTDASTMPDENLTITAQWALDACFTMEANSSASSNVELAKKEAISSGSKNCSTLSGGTARNGNYGTLAVEKLSSGHYGWKFGSTNNDTLVVDLTGTKLQTGSIITVSGYAGTSGGGIRINNCTIYTKPSTSGAFEAQSYTVKNTDTDLVGKHILKIQRVSSSTVYLSAISISNCADRPSYNVTYKANGGVSATGEDVVHNVSEVEGIGDVSFTRAGYDFDGWKTGESSGTSYAVGDEVPSALTLYAQWSCVTPTIGTDLSTSQVTYRQDASADALTVAATANGSGGNGTVSYQWYSNTANSTTSPTPTTLIGQTSASYTPSTASIGTTYYFCVITNSSSGCSTTATSKIAKIVVEENPCFEITDAGKNGSWTKSSGETIESSNLDGKIDGGVVTYTGSGSLTGNDTHGIIFDNDNDELTITFSDNKVLDEGSVISIKQHGNSSSSKSTGFKINGLSMSPETCNNGSTAYKENTQTYTVPAASAMIGTNSFTIKWTGTNQVYLKSMTVTGCGERLGYTVTYADGGATSGSVPVDANSPYEENDEVTVLGNTGSLAKNGYTFAGWNDGTNDYEAGDKFDMPAENVTLTAQWTPNDYTITYNLNGASWAGGYSAPAEYTVGTGATLPVAGNMTNTGYTFGGWYDNSGLTGSSVTTISTSDYDDKEFWAKWTENTYTITYNKNDGSATGTTDATNGHYVTVADCGFELADHMFAGWNTKSDGSGDSYSAGDEIELTANMTLYAQWGDDYTISWDASAKLNGVAATPNLGGGNYTITAGVSSWTGTLTTSMISALTDGVTITNVAVDNSSSPKTITATFNVGASVAGESISFELDVPAAGDFGAKSSTKDITIDRCTGSSSGSDGVLFSAEFKDSGLGTSNICDAANTPFTFTTDQLKAAPTGGSIKAYSTSNLGHMKYATNAISIAGSDGVIEITLDNAIATNDLFTYLNVNSSSSAAYLRHTSADNTTDQIALTVYNNKEAKVRLTSGFNGKKTLYVVRNSSDFKLHKAAVVRPAFLMLLRDDTPTSTTNIEGTDVEITTSTYLTTIQGGRVYYTSPSSGDLKIYRSSSKNYVNFKSGTGYLKVVLDAALQEGDVIGFDSYNTNNLDFTTTAEHTSVITTTNQLYTVNSSSALKGKTTFYIWQHSGSSDYLRGLQIARSGVAGGSGGSDQITPTLTWTPALESDADWDGTNSRLAKETGDADFTFTVTQDKNSLGAITYASSNTSVATVTSAGKVHIVGAGEATITATMAESGCYEEATAEYDIYVEDNCEDAAGTITVKDLGCGNGYELTVSGHTIGDAVTYQWYKDGVSMGGSYVAAKCTVTVAGEYYVVVDNTGSAGSYHCAMASDNTITIEATETATATKIVDSWYVKNGRRTPDIALVQTENANGFTVKSSSTVIWNSDGSVTTGFAGCGFYLGTDGIIYLKGQKADGTAPSGLTAGDETLTITATSCGGDADDVEITIHKQAATTRPSVAFVVDGTKEGDFDAENEDHSVGTALYDYLDYTRNGSGALDLFDLTPQNVYSTVDEKAIRQHYSQFDAIIITDDPSTSTKIGKKSCVNAFGTMIDIRPILTMEAYVSSLSNWKAKGISGNPTSPNPRQYAMKLECKDHAIFNGLNPASDNVEVETVDGVDYWTVTMVDKTKTPYAGLDDDEETGGGQKPALQGFSASNVDGLLLLGEISEGTLYAGVERQDEPAARLMLLGVQYKALPSALTPEGLIVIKNALKYLLKTDMEEVDDCSNYFTDAYGDHKWSTAANWSKGKAPDVTVKARILKPCIVDGTAYAAQVDIATSGKSSKFDTPADCSGKLTIDPTGALIVGGEVRSANAPYFNTGDLMPTTVNDLVLNTNGSNQSALIFNNDKGDTKATVNLYSLGRKIDDSYQFQYMAVPMNYVPVNPSFAGSGIYTYVWNEASGWERRGYYTDLYAFEAVGLTTKFGDARSYIVQGNLASTAEKEITLTHESAAEYGSNIIGNSWTAPIDIASLKDAIGDDAKVQKTVYIYCTGKDVADLSGSTSETPGQWLAVPIDASGWSGWTGLKVVPAMQAFLIRTSAETSLTLNYNEVVRTTAAANLNVPLRAPQRTSDEEAITLTTLHIEDSQTSADLYLFEGEQFSDEFDNGWEASYMGVDGRSAQLYAMASEDKMAVLATPELEGTQVGFMPGKETAYTFSFTGGTGTYYLNDIKAQKSALIQEGNTYSFEYENGDAANRFYISKTAIDAPAVGTGVDNTQSGVKVQKFIYQNKLYILRNGVLYDATGKVVK